MKIELLGEPQVIMSNYNSSHSYFAWPTAKLLQNGKIMVGASGFRIEHICPFGKSVACFSSDEGKSYSLPVPVIDTPLDDRDTGICTFGEKGVIVTTFNNSVDFQRQHNKENEYAQNYVDSIKKSDEEKYLGSLFRISYDCGSTFGEIFHSPVTSPHGPVTLKDGTVLWAGNNFENYGDGIEVIKINTIDGETEFIGKIKHDNKNVELCEPSLIELPDGKLLCHIRGDSEEVLTVYQSVSEDKGKTWSYPEMIIDKTDGAPPHLVLLKSGILLSTYGRRKQPYGIMAMVSKDFGKTWEKNIRIYENTVSDDIGYPSTVELSDGTLLTAFYAKEKECETAPCVIMQQRWKII